VIVAEDFTFAASSVMGDDVTGLGFPACDTVDALPFSSLAHWRPPAVCIWLSDKRRSMVEVAPMIGVKYSI
jgi:hypothetical protein